MKNKIEIRCKKCGKLAMEIEVEGKVKYDFKCKRCSCKNIGIVKGLRRKYGTNLTIMDG